MRHEQVSQHYHVGISNAYTNTLLINAAIHLIPRPLQIYDTNPFFSILSLYLFWRAQVYITTSYSWQRWKRLGVPWYVQHDNRKSRWCCARLHIFLRCDRIMGESAKWSPRDDTENLTWIQDTSRRRQLATVCRSIPTKSIGAHGKHVRHLNHVPAK